MAACRSPSAVLFLIITTRCMISDAIVCYYCHSGETNPNNKCVYPEKNGAETVSCGGIDNACGKLHVHVNGQDGLVDGRIMARHCVQVPQGKFSRCIKLDGLKVSNLPNFPTESLKEVVENYNGSKIYPEHVKVISGAICRCKQDVCNNQPKHELGDLVGTMPETTAPPVVSFQQRVIANAAILMNPMWNIILQICNNR